jgi:hypothetical protein
MKKQMFWFSLAMLLSLAATNEVSAQRFCVRVRPVVRFAPRPVAHHPRQVWVDGDWVWDARRANYVYQEGYWADPRPRQVWVAGHWARSRHGDYWVAGYWR